MLVSEAGPVWWLGAGWQVKFRAHIFRPNEQIPPHSHLPSLILHPPSPSPPLLASWNMIIIFAALHKALVHTGIMPHETPITPSQYHFDILRPLCGGLDGNIGYCSFFSLHAIEEERQYQSTISNSMLQSYIQLRRTQLSIHCCETLFTCGEDNSATAESNPTDTIPHNHSIHWRTKGQSARTGCMV